MNIKYKRYKREAPNTLSIYELLLSVRCIY